MNSLPAVVGFFGYPFEGLPTLFLLDKLAAIRIAFRPVPINWVLNLGTVVDGTLSIAFACVRSHMSPRV